MYRTLLAACAAFLLLNQGLAQAQKDLNVHHMLRGYFHAASSLEDKDAFGGFATSDNKAQHIDSRFRFATDRFELIVDTTRIVTFARDFNGYNAYLINGTDELVEIDASDSRLPIIAEARVKGQWQPVEYLPSSWCGNSYHTVYLKGHEFWRFSVPKYGGKWQVMLRYRLETGTNQYLYSNEFVAGINPKQLSRKQGHKPQGLMDPYND